MRLPAKVKDNKHHVDLWLTIFQGGVNITSREKDVLSELILSYMMLKEKGLIEPYLSKEVLGTDIRKHVCESLDISTFNLTNILASLKAKGCIFADQINPQLIPERELIFEFK